MTQNKKYATTIWKAGRDKYPTLDIPREMAKAHNLDHPCQVVLTDTRDGILIKSLEKQFSET